MLCYYVGNDKRIEKIFKKIDRRDCSYNYNIFENVLDVDRIYYDRYKEKVIDKNDEAVIIFTSGTTGKSKEVVLSHRNLVLNMLSIGEKIWLRGDSILILPLSHAFGLTSQLLLNIYYGQALYISNGIGEYLNEIQYVNPDNLFIVPIIIEYLYHELYKNLEDKKELSELMGNRIRYIVLGGAAVEKKYIEAFVENGVDVLVGYGTTECSPVISVNTQWNNKIGSVGELLNCNKIKIENPNNNGIGEILVKGSNVMLGYYKDNLETDKSMQDGYYKTGALGKYEKGHLYITGRNKNMILFSNGNNVYPEEIENIIKIENSYISEIIVYAEENKIVAEIYCKQHIEKRIIQNDIEKINKKLPNYKRINNIKIRKKCFDRTHSGKVIRNKN